MSRRIYLSLFGVAVAARIAGIWIPQLWYDENFTLILARLPFDRMMTATAGDVHPPLWYLIEWAWMHILPTAPVWTMRVPSLVFSVLAFVAFKQLLDELRISEKIQIVTLALMALLPMQLWYAQEARMYAMLEYLVIAALLFALRREWTKLFIASLAMLYTQNYSMFYLACIGLLVFVEDVYALDLIRQTNRAIASVSDAAYRVRPFIPTRHTAGVMSLAFALYIPWLAVLRSQMLTISGRYWIQEQSIGDMLNIVYKLFWSSAMPSWALISALLVTFMAIATGLIHLAKASRSVKQIVMVMAFGPLFMAWAVSMIWQPILLYRPLIGSAPFLYLIAAWSLGRLFELEPVRSWREAAISAALIVPILFSGTAGYFKNIPSMKSDGAVSPLMVAVAYARAHWQPGDVLYFTDDGPMINVSPYAQDLPMFTMAACGERMNYGPVLGSLSPVTREAIGVPVRDFGEFDYKRAWVFAPRSPLHPKCYEEQIAPLTNGAPLVTVDENMFISSGMWLVEKSNYTQPEGD